MKNIFKNKLYVLLPLFSFVLLMLSCGQKYDDLAQPSTETPRKPWQPHPSVLYENFNCEVAWADSSRMYVAGRQYFMEFDSLHRLVRKVKYQTDTSFDYYYEKPYIDNRFFIYFADEKRTMDKIVVRSVENLSLMDTIFSKDLPAPIDKGYYNWFVREHLSFCRVVGDRLVVFVSAISPTVAIYKINKNTNSLTVDYEGYVELYGVNPNFAGPSIFGAHAISEDELYVGGYSPIQLNVRTRQIQPLNITAVFADFGKIKDTLYIRGRTVFGIDSKLSINTLVNGQFSETIFEKHLLPAILFFTGDECFGTQYYNRGIYDIKFTRIDDKMQIDINTIDDLGVIDIQQLIRFKDRMYVVSVNGLYYKPLSEFRVYK